MKSREVVLGKMQSWIGKCESNGTHREIIDIYNTIKPLPRGVKMPYTSPWCATTVSSAYHSVGYDDIFPFECSCGQMIEKAKKMGIWVEDDSYIPSISDVIMYDWDDNGKGDCTGAPEHTGLVESIAPTTMCIIEGNCSNAVKRRIISINGRYIRGFIVPKFDDNSCAKIVTPIKSMPMLKRGSYCSEVGVLQRALKLKGYTLEVNNSFGLMTESCVVHFQYKNNLEVDGIVGNNTWKKLGIT